MGEDSSLQKFETFVKFLKNFIEHYSRFKKLSSKTRSPKNLKNQINKIEQELSKFEKEINQIFELKLELEEFKKAQVQKIENEKQIFGNKLFEELKKIGIELSGQIPNFSAGLFKIIVNFDEEKAKIWYGPEQEFVGLVDLDTKKIVTKIKETKEKLSVKFYEKDFFQTLKRAYEIVVDYQFGKPAPIIQVLYQFALLLQGTKFLIDPKKENYTSYGRINFSYDLYRLQKTSTLNLFNYQFELITATRDLAKDRDKFLWIPINEKGEGTVYSHIKIKEKVHG